MRKTPATHARDVETTYAEIDRAIVALLWLRAQVPTLHSMSYEQGNAGTEKTRGSKKDHYGDEAGRLDCRGEWVRLRAWLGLSRDRKVRDSLHALTAIKEGVERVLTSDGVNRIARVRKAYARPISQAELDAALAAQRKRGSQSRLDKQRTKAPSK